MKNKFLFIFCFGVLLLLPACKQNPDNMTRTPIFKVLGPDGTDNTEVNIDGKAQNVNFTVLASEEWMVSMNGSDAFSLTETTGGSGKMTISLNANANETGANRTASILFSLIGKEDYSYAFNVSQEEQKPYLEASPETVVVSSYGGEFTVNVNTNQSEWTYDLGDGKSWINLVSKTETSAIFSVPENASGAKRDVDVMIYAVNAPELLAYVSVSQDIPAAPPTADLLDVVFNADRTATDKSALKMTVDNSRLNSDNTVIYREKYGRYAAQFNNSTIGRSKLDTGYWLIPYTSTSTFGAKLADGYSYELLFCNYEDAETTQVKPFSSTQAGGTGVCLRAGTGEINFETHTGGSWQMLYSGIVPKKNVYYHVVATWDKINSLACLYVNGILTATKNAGGDFKFMETSVDARWFGIGADPSGVDQGETSFYGEVVIARLYDDPMSAEEVTALYNLVK